jgi:hypothetical protein
VFLATLVGVSVCALSLWLDAWFLRRSLAGLKSFPKSLVWYAAGGYLTWKIVPWAVAIGVREEETIWLATGLSTVVPLAIVAVGWLLVRNAGEGRSGTSSDMLGDAAAALVLGLLAFVLALRLFPEAFLWSCGLGAATASLVAVILARRRP